jgi:hypothetical protein
MISSCCFQSRFQSQWKMKRSKRAYMAKKARGTGRVRIRITIYHITHRATVGTINDDADSNDDMDVPTARKGEVPTTTSPCAIANLSTYEVAAGESIIADERGADLPVVGSRMNTVTSRRS